MTAKHSTNRVWLVLAALSMVCATALPAGATPPTCEENPEHPRCDAPVDDEPMAGTTCNAIGEWGEPVSATSDTFPITLTEGACIDVIATEGDWTVDIETSDGTRWLSLVIRDSVAPGDTCEGVMYRRDIPSQVTLDGPDNSGIAGAWVNSCGTEWAEWVGDDYYADEDQSVLSPLVFQVFMDGKDPRVTLHVTLPE